MAHMTPDQIRRRERVESLIRLAAPGLNLVLAVGERISRLVESEDQEYYPPRGRTDAGEGSAAHSRPGAPTPGL